MSQSSTAPKVLRQYQSLFGSGIAGNLSDREMLETYLGRTGELREAAFVAMLDRHGPMVLRVCTQALDDPHDAEDAFQVTFFVLARQAGSIRKRHSLASWLFGVACRAVAQIRLKEARRRRSERDRWIKPDAIYQSGPSTRDISLDLLSEIERLPQKYREALILCYFEGLTHEQAASRLRWPVGTVKVRLSRARERIRRRLERQGWSMPILITSQTADSGAHANLFESLLHSTLSAVRRSGSRCRLEGIDSSRIEQITHGVFRAMMISKLKWSAVLFAGMLAVGLGGAVVARQAGGKPDPRLNAPVNAQGGGRGDQPVLRIAGATSLDSDAVLGVRPPFDCRVDKVLVEVGTTVKQGDPLLELFSTDLAAAKNDYEMARSQHDRDKTVLDYKAPLAQNNALPRRELMDAQNEEAKSRLQMKLAREKLLVYGLTESEIEQTPNQDAQQKARLILRSRAGGMVIRRNVVTGNFHDTRDELLEIAPVDHLWVTARVPEQNLQTLKRGQSMTLRFTFDDRPLKGKVEFIDPVVDPATGTVKIRTTIPNPDHRLKAGMFAQVELETASDPEPVTGPRPEEQSPGGAAVSETRLDALERKVDQLFKEQQNHSQAAKILGRLDELERKLDWLLEVNRKP
jgi:RND family efflux transporter MFP subunit